MGELQGTVVNFPAWKAILWCFYPIATFVLLEFVLIGIDDDDEHGGGKMIPITQGS